MTLQPIPSMCCSRIVLDPVLRYHQRELVRARNVREVDRQERPVAVTMRKIGTFTPSASKSRVTPSGSKTSMVRA